MLADRVLQIKPSATLAISNKARKLRAKGEHVIAFGAGELDFDTPQNVKDAAIRALMDGHTKYTPVGGTDELKDAIRYRLHAETGLQYERAQVIACTGAKHALFNVAMALFQPGDEVLLPSPYWVSYPELIKVAGATPVLLPTDEKSRFKITPEQLENAVTPHTKAIILNSPSNPTGAVYIRQELEDLSQVLKKNNILIISDDIYNRIVYHDIRLASIAAMGGNLKERTIIINGVSKTYAMTGWRIGYALGPEEIIAAMTKIQGQSTSNPTSMAQKAAVEAMTGPQDFVDQIVRELDNRRRYMIYALNELDGVTCSDPGGTFYVFPRVDSFFGKKAGEKVIQSASELAEYLLDEVKVAVVPGEAFGAGNYIRLSFATSRDEIEEGINRIEEALGKLE